MKAKNALSPDGPTPYLPIGDYALLSDCHSTALVSRDGSIDWACLRRFDAASTFARLLDHDHGGYFALTPVGEIVSRSRRYVEDTMVLETTLEVANGSIVVTDAFAMQSGGARAPSNALVRRVVCTSGEVVVNVTLRPRFDYGRSHPWLLRHGARVVSAVAGSDALAVHADFDLAVDGDDCCVTAQLTMATGDAHTIVSLAQAAHELDTSPLADLTTLLDQTIGWWQRWSADTVAHGPHALQLRRSALVLKALCCAPTGAIIAAPTTSLPEIVGGSANWDYRYCWIRDATLTLEALSAVGHLEVARGFRTFLMRSAAGRGDELQIMYGAYGERQLPESIVGLQGWRGSAPVRIGNGAAAQTQLDMYGHILDAVHLWHQRHHGLSHDEWRFISSLVDIAITRWDQPDSGIWEVRGELQHFVHSKVMVWVAIDRGIRLVQEHGYDDVDVDRWIAARDKVRVGIESSGVDPDGGHFVRSFGSAEVDASLLQLALVGFVEPDDPRMVRTVAKIQRDLSVPNGFIRRYRVSDASATVDGSAEGVFLLCTSWLVQVLSMQGRAREAEALFEKLLAVGNDVGLFAEQYEPDTGEFLGNYPQAFTHLGLIAAAMRLQPGD
jgi:GH15 family glucan-1,4-alpha-glucosidase